MAFVHSKNTVVKVATHDLSTFCKSSEFGQKLDSHDLTGYGAESHGHEGGLLDGTFKMNGTYDNTASTGPRAVLQGAIQGKVSVALIRQPEGAGSGKAQDSFNWLVTSYVETAPVADYIAWAAGGDIDGDVDSTPQT